MRRTVTTVGGTRRRPRGVVIGTVVALGLVGLTTVVVLRSGDEPPSDRRAVATPPSDRATAAAAALRFAQILAVDGVRHPKVYGSELESIAAPGAPQRLRETFGVGAEQVRSLLAGRSSVLRAAPIGYRFESWSRESARVAIWMVALAGGPKLEPVAQWRLLTLDLSHTSAGWRVQDGTGERGPSPLSPLPQLAVEANTFQEVRHVP